jgi:hypothetical protein
MGFSLLLPRGLREVCSYDVHATEHCHRSRATHPTMTRLLFLLIWFLLTVSFRPECPRLSLACGFVRFMQSRSVLPGHAGLP